MINQPSLLLVEDNDDDVFLMRRALKKAELSWPLHVVLDGKEALDYLAGAGLYTDRDRHPLPALIFLDLKLPYVHGFEVLHWIRSKSTLKNLPVVVLTSSPEERDRKKAEELGAKAYLVKPPSGEMVRDAIRFVNVQSETRPDPVPQP